MIGTRYDLFTLTCALTHGNPVSLPYDLKRKKRKKNKDKKGKKNEKMTETETHAQRKLERKKKTFNLTLKRKKRRTRQEKMDDGELGHGRPIYSFDLFFPVTLKNGDQGRPMRL